MLANEPFPPSVPTDHSHYLFLMTSNATYQAETNIKNLLYLITKSFCVMAVFIALKFL